MKTSNPTEAENSTRSVSSHVMFKKKERQTAKNHNDGLDDVHVHPFELVTLHKLG